MKNQEQIQAWYIQGNGAMSQEESEQKEKGWWGGRMRTEVQRFRPHWAS